MYDGPMEYGDKTLINIGAGTIVKTIVIFILFALLFYLRDLVLVLLLSIVVASAVEPGTQWLMKKKIPRLFAVILIYTLIVACFAGTIFFLLIPLLSESADFLRNFPTYFSSGSISENIAESSFLASEANIVNNITSSFNLDKMISQINSVIGGISSDAFGTVTTFFGGLLSFILMFIISFYLAVEEDGVGKFLKAITPIKHEKYIVALWKRSQKKIGLWMQGQLVLSIFIGVLIYLPLALFQFPNALLLAVLAAVLELIPLFGPILASIPAIAIAFVTGGMPAALSVSGLYVVVHQFENHLIYPLVVKKVVGVSPIVSIVALAAGWHLAGFVGIILAVPIAAVIIEFIDDLEKDKIEKTERMLNATN